MRSPYWIAVYFALVVLGVFAYRWGVRKFLFGDEHQGPRIFWNPLLALGVILVPFLLWISGTVGLFYHSAGWGLAGLLIALLGLFSVVVRRP